MSVRWAVLIAAAVAMGAFGQAQQPLTLRGEIVEVSCYTKLGIEKSTGAAHTACAKECAAKGQPLAILTDGDGLVKITGDYAADKYAKLLPYVGRQVEVTGTSDRYLDYSRAINVTKLSPATAEKYFAPDGGLSPDALPRAPAARRALPVAGYCAERARDSVRGAGRAEDAARPLRRRDRRRRAEFSATHLRLHAD